MRLNSLGFAFPFLLFGTPPDLYIPVSEKCRKAGITGKAYKTGNSQRKKRKLARQTGNY